MGFSEIKNKALHLLAETVIVRENVDEQTAKDRFSICLSCPKRNEKENVCDVCGCFLDLKAGSKINWNARQMRSEITHCPMGKWNDKETANFYREIDGKDLLN